MRAHVALALGCTWIVGCADGGSSAEQPGDEQPITESTRDRAPVVEAPAREAPPPAAPLTFQCRADAFCEDFESQDPASRWSGEVGSGFTFVGPSATKGAQSLRVTSAGAPAFLRLDGGDVGRSAWGALAFAVRFDAAPATSIGGPALVAKLPSGDEVSIGIGVTAEGLVLEQRTTGACAQPACKQKSDLVALAKPGGWHDVVVGFEINSTGLSPYGRVEVGVDGAELVTRSLLVPFYDATIEVRAGITRADTAPSELQIDDVMFFVK